MTNSDQPGIPSECQCGCGPDCEQCLTLEIDDQGSARYLCDCTVTPVCFCPAAVRGTQEATTAPRRAAPKPPRSTVKAHDHEWVLERVTLFTSPARATPIPGASVLWRCSRRDCAAARVSEYKFRRPSKRQTPNVFSRDYPPEKLGSLGNIG